MLIQRLEEHLAYLAQKEAEFRPVIDVLQQVILSRREELYSMPIDQLSKMLVDIMSLHTDCIMLTTKIKEVLQYEGCSNLS